MKGVFPMGHKAEVPKDPTPGFKRRLLSKSHEQACWVNACSEWAIVDLIEADPIYGDSAPPSDDRLDFVQNCELCGARLHIFNFIVENEHTAERLRVGSDCVKRFKVLKGVAGGDVVTYVDRYTRDQIHMTAIRKLCIALGTSEVDRTALIEFHKAAEALVGPIRIADDWYRKGARLLEIAEVHPDSWLADRIEAAFLNPTSLPLSRQETKAFRAESEEKLRLQFGWRKHKTQRVEHVGSGRSHLYKQNRLDRGMNE